MEIVDLVTGSDREEFKIENFQNWVKCDTKLLNINFAQHPLEPTQPTPTSQSQMDVFPMSMWMDKNLATLNEMFERVVKG